MLFFYRHSLALSRSCVYFQSQLTCCRIFQHPASDESAAILKLYVLLAIHTKERFTQRMKGESVQVIQKKCDENKVKCIHKSMNYIYKNQDSLLKRSLLE